MGALGPLFAKDLRLLWRDRAGLFFLMIAPMVVIAVAGFSLANLYGADPSGQTAYELPFVNEDGGTLGRSIRERLANETSVRLQPVATRAEAEDLVRRKRAGSALVVPAGPEAALDRGEPARLVLYVDTVKYLERLNVRAKLSELREDLARERATRLADDARAERERVAQQLGELRSRTLRAHDELEAAWNDAAKRRRGAEASIARARDDVAQALDARLAPLRAYLDQLAAKRRAFEDWLAELRRLAGSRADAIPPPPAFPEPPPMVSAAGALPKLALELPALPALPKLDVPDVALPPPPAAVRASLGVDEVNVGGGAVTMNTFDQNVPGFAVTFILLGMLLGVSLGLVDERDWGTLDRLRAMPVSLTQVLVAKLGARFCVGVAQMMVLLAVGWLCFGVSLGPEPWALVLPTIGIVFAGAAFGLVVAGATRSREALLPVGSIVIMTMAAVGGCWWPIDLEPRWMREVALAFPTTWAMDAFNDLMMRHRRHEAALVPTAVMLTYGLVYLAAGVALYRRRLR